jgi:hypothetical protein
MIETNSTANLGLATTEEMLRELICRFKLDGCYASNGSIRAIERALTLSELLGGLDGPTREYKTV